MVARVARKLRALEHPWRAVGYKYRPDPDACSCVNPPSWKLHGGFFFSWWCHWPPAALDTGGSACVCMWVAAYHATSPPSRIQSSPTRLSAVFPRGWVVLFSLSLSGSLSSSHILFNSQISLGQSTRSVVVPRGRPLLSRPRHWPHKHHADPEREQLDEVRPGRPRNLWLGDRSSITSFSGEATPGEL